MIWRGGGDDDDDITWKLTGNEITKATERLKCSTLVSSSDFLKFDIITLDINLKCTTRYFFYIMDGKVILSDVRQRKETRKID